MFPVLSIGEAKVTEELSKLLGPEGSMEVENPHDVKHVVQVLEPRTCVTLTFVIVYSFLFCCCF